MKLSTLAPSVAPSVVTASAPRATASSPPPLHRRDRGIFLSTVNLGR
jgi:hypothetical protein